ncbi:hypothetical protein G6F43_012130 [Rhizopus delemar]|nr:hypothetical protein G6F43_012130 [Rhizopus delemar]
MAPITIDEIIQETVCVKNKISSPREDGRGYAFLYQLFRYPPLQELVSKVYNQAHSSSIFPHSWQELRVMPSFINRCQTGFMPSRFIAENGLVLNIVMQHARKDNRQEIALILDQEKAYDRVHFSYLRSMLLQFGFPTVLVNSLVGLFFGNRVRVNINGHHTEEVTQPRSLRQGDPLSPLLFNLVLEPFLRYVLQDTSLFGFSFLPLSADSNPLPALKVLAYSDDVCVFLSSPADFLRLQHHLQIYGGKSSNQWQQLHAQHQIRKWHDHTKSQPLRYLGFPVIQYIAQRRYVEGPSVTKHQNSIVVSLPKSFFRQIRSTIYQFILKGIKPGFRYTLLCQPLSKDGLGLLDPFIQHCSSQVRWLRLLFTDDLQSSCSQAYLKDFIRRFHSSGTSSLLSCFFPALHSTTDVSVGSFLPALYTTMDSFLNNGMPEVQCNPSTLLCLPICSLFSEIPDGHWLRSPHRSKSRARHYFTYDQSLKRIRPMLRSDSPSHPRLSARLLRDLQNRTVKLNEMTWQVILNTSTDPGSVTDYPFVTWLTRSFDWVSFCPRVYRQNQLDSMLPCPASIIPSDGWLRFWNLTILPEARSSFCFRFIHGKLHNQSSIVRFNPDVSATCKFCNVPSEDISHLLVEFPHKWSIWQEALSRFAPHLDSQPTDILTLLLYLTCFDYIDNTTLLRLSYYILLFLWRAHWRYIFDDVPLLPERIVTAAFEKIGTFRLH